MLVILCALTYSCHCQNDPATLGIQIDYGSIVQHVFGLLSWNDGAKVPFLEATCTPSLKGKIKKFKWVYDAKFSCNKRFTGIVGKQLNMIDG